MNYPERDIDDIFESPSGFGNWVFMHFTTPFRVKTPLGIIEREAGDFLINSPDYPQWHQGRDVCFKNDWFHFESHEIASLLKEWEIPVNIPFSCSSEFIILPLLHKLKREHIVQDQYFEMNIDLICRQLFIELSRGRERVREQSLTDREKEFYPRFQELRIHMHRTLQENWSIQKMADEMALSPSRFAFLYKRFFGISPISDLLENRLNRSKILLHNQTVKVETVAQECGFSSLHYFWRMFKKQFGTSPSEFRRQQKS